MYVLAYEVEDLADNLPKVPLTTTPMIVEVNDNSFTTL